MKHNRYKVAGHLFEVVCTQDQLDTTQLIPSFSPFVSDEEGELLFSMDVSEGPAPDFSQQDEIGQFDCGGANHGVYATSDGGYAFEISLPDVFGGGLSCSMEAHDDFRHCRATLTSHDLHRQQFGLNNALMMAFAFAAATQQTLLVHASVIRNAGYGYLFTAPSGTGKSTHTHLWYKHIPGSDLMNDDNPVVRIIGDEARIYGSPWSGKTPCYRNISAPIGAITRIEQRPYNEMRRFSPVEAFAALLPAVSSMKWDRRVYNGISGCIARLIGIVPVYWLGCLPDEAAAQLSYATIAVKKSPEQNPS